MATTKAGRRCRAWAIKGHDLCSRHAGLLAVTEEDRRAGRACTALTRAGARCPNWAVVGTEEAYGRLLCSAHLPEGDERRAYPGWLYGGPRAGAQRCVAKTWDGTRCRYRAMRGEEGTRGDLCWMHAFPEKHPAIRHGYYWRTPHFSDEEHAAIEREAQEGEPMAAELLLIRLKLRDVLKYTGEDELPAERLDSAARVAFRGASAVATLLKARRKLVEIYWKPTSAGEP